MSFVNYMVMIFEIEKDDECLDISIFLIIRNRVGKLVFELRCYVFIF